MDRGKGSSDDGGSMEQNRRFKKAILDVLFQYCETFYIHCMPHPDLAIGRRGLLDREKTEGIVLVFGPHSTRQLSWDDRLMYCELQFNRWEPVSIPYECVARMFDKDGQVIMQWSALAPEENAPTRGPLGGPRRSGTTGPERSRGARDFGATADSSSESATDHGAAKGSGESPEKSGESRVIEVDFTRRRKEGEESSDPDDSESNPEDDGPDRA